MALSKALAERRIWTYEEYCALPDDGQRYEVIGGKLYVVPGPTPEHQTVVTILVTFLTVFVLEHNLGKVWVAPLDVMLSLGNILQPDIIFIRQERLATLRTPQNIQGSPDLAVEVLSPRTARRDRTTKRDQYAAHGIPHYWLVDPRTHTLEAYELREGVYVLVDRRSGDETFSPALFPGLTIPLARLWS